MVDTPELEDQDQAEVLDETHLTVDGEDIANFDTLEDVLDLTQEIGDAGEDEADSDGIETEEDVDEDMDADLSPRTRLEDRPDSGNDAPPERTDADAVPDDESARPAGMEGED